MDSTWPVEEQERRTMTVPLFPLPEVFLFPGQLLPLLIFEPRYRQMIEDELDGPGRIVLGTASDEPTGPADNPPVLPTAGLGEIVHHERLDGGRFKVLLLGLARVKVEEIPSERLYRQVRCRLVRERQPSEEDARRLQELLAQAIEARTSVEIDEPEQVSAGQLADILAQSLTISARQMEEIFAEEVVATRAAKVLAVHAKQPPQTRRQG